MTLLTAKFAFNIYAACNSQNLRPFKNYSGPDFLALLGPLGGGGEKVHGFQRNLKARTLHQS